MDETTSRTPDARPASSSSAAAKTTDHDDRRREPRVPVVLQVAYESAGALKTEFAENISKAGLFIATHEPFTVGQPVRLEIRCAGMPQSVRVGGEVRWVGTSPRRPDQTPVPGIGVQFDLGDPLEVSRLESMVDAAFEPVPPSAYGERLNLLLVEPNAHTRRLYSAGIEEIANRELDRPEHVYVVSARSAAMAEELLDESDFSMVLTELGLPDRDGFAFVRTLREMLGAKLPICAIARGFPGDQARAVAAGATLFVRKPVVLKSLFNALKVELRVSAEGMSAAGMSAEATAGDTQCDGA